MKKVEVDGVEYVLARFNWGVSTEIHDAAMVVEAVGSVVPTVTMKLSIYMRQVVLRSLKTWTFLGVDEEGNPLKDGEVLAITEENVKTLPSNHGNKLWEVASDLNGLSKDEEKN